MMKGFSFMDGENSVGVPFDTVAFDIFGYSAGDAILVLIEWMFCF